MMILPFHFDYGMFTELLKCFHLARDWAIQSDALCSDIVYVTSLFFSFTPINILFFLLSHSGGQSRYSVF